MIEIVIGKNDADQRFDRFLKKLLEFCPLSEIQKNIRKKNFKLNGKRAQGKDFLKEGDIVNLYISDALYNKWKRKDNYKPGDFNLNVAYEDKNILIMDKPKGLLTHAARKKDYGNNLVDQMNSYLYKTGQLKNEARTFRPAVVNRLDRNTEGLIIGAKNAQALRSLNKAMREKKIESYYLALVSGEVKGNFTVDTRVGKNEKKNKISGDEEGFEIKTDFKSLLSNKKYSLVECKLITGKTHQIRYSLSKLGHPILGDPKYGKKMENQNLERVFGIKGQELLAYKLIFGEIEGLEYLDGKKIVSSLFNDFYKLKDRLFDED